MSELIHKPLSPENQARWDELQKNWGNPNYNPGRTSMTGGLAPRLPNDEFIGMVDPIGPGPQSLSDNPESRTPVDVVDAWHQYDQLSLPGGLYHGLNPHQRAGIEADLIQQYGDRPAPIDPYDVLRQRVEQRFSLGTEVTEEWATLLDAQLNAIKDNEVAMYTARAKTEMGVEAYSAAVIAAARVLGPENVDERVKASVYALRYLHSVDTQRSRRDAEMARLPKRKA